MKTLLLFSICSLLLLCSCEMKKEPSYQEEYNELYKSELKSGKIMNEVFLGFKFGDTEKQVKIKLEELRKQKKLFYNSAYQYCYEIKLDTNAIFSKAIGVLGFQYYKDSLYKVTLIFTSSDNFTNSQSYQIYALNAQSLYGKKYGYGDWILHQDDNKKDIINFVKIIGNCEINIAPNISNFEISYTDLTKSKLIEKEADNKEKKAVEKTSKDI